MQARASTPFGPVVHFTGFSPRIRIGFVNAVPNLKEKVMGESSRVPMNWFELDTEQRDVITLVATL